MTQLESVVYGLSALCNVILFFIVWHLRTVIRDLRWKVRAVERRNFIPTIRL